MVIHPVPKPPQGVEPVLPDEALCYVAGGNGLFKIVRNSFYSACVKLGGIPSLAEIQEEAELHVPVLPLTLFRQVEAFFVAVYAQHQSEAVVLLYCNPNEKEWRVVVPPQYVRGLHVEYDLNALPKAPAGLELFGTIHSHADIKAFHSGTDDADECHFDGLHVTVGNVDQPIRTYSCRWMLAGRAFKADLAGVVESAALPKPDVAWLAKVSLARAAEPKAREIHNIAPLGAGDRAEGPWFDSYGEAFASREEYLEYLEQMREEIDERLWEAEQLEIEGEPHGSKR